MVARRPRRALLSAASIAVTMTGVVAVLAFHRTVDVRLAGVSSGLGNPVVSRDEQMLQIITVVLIALAVLNAVVTAWATVLDTRRPAALARALGSTPGQISAGVTAAQVLPALPGALVGVPLGIGLFAAANHAGIVTVPPVCVADRGRAGHPAGHRGADQHPGPRRRPPRTRRDPASRDRLTTPSPPRDSG